MVTNICTWPNLIISIGGGGKNDIAQGSSGYETMYHISVIPLGTIIIPDNMLVHGANMGPMWGRQDPGGPHVGPMNHASLDMLFYTKTHSQYLKYKQGCLTSSWEYIDQLEK